MKGVDKMCTYKIDGTTYLSFLSRKNLKKALELVDKMSKGIELTSDEVSFVDEMYKTGVFRSGIATGLLISAGLFIGAFGTYKVIKWFQNKKNETKD